jgi:hypothetical protein
VENKANDYLIDREAQKRFTFTGIAGVRAQDAMVTETAGPIVDRTREHLGTSDIAIIKMRRRLISEARALMNGDGPPLASRSGKVYRVRPHQAVLPRDKRFDQDEDVMTAMYP